jgi:hypothetical protein
MLLAPLSSILLIAVQQPFPAIQPDVPAHAVLTDSSPVAPGGRRAESFAYRCVPGMRVRIDALSAWDNMAFVIGARDTIKARDDDSGDHNNARIHWTCPDNGTYRIAVASYHERVGGAFELRVASLGIAGVPRPLPMLAPDTVARGELPPGAPQFLGRPMVYYGVRCAPDAVLSIEMVSQFDNVLYLFGPSGMIAWNDDADGTNAALLLPCRDAGLYRIGAAAREGHDAGPFRIHLRNLRGRPAR